MKLREWLDMKVDEAAAKHDVDNSTAHVVDINQKMLSDVIFAAQVMDRRIEIIEAKLGLDAFDIPTKATGILPN